MIRGLSAGSAGISGLNELSLHVLDVAENCIRAGAENIGIRISEDREHISFSVTDDGCGMTEEELGKLTDPHYSTKKNACGGFGIPALAALCRRTGGHLTVSSTPAGDRPDHGTTVTASLQKSSPDCIPLGNTVETVMAVIAGANGARVTFLHETEAGVVRLDTDELSPTLGDVSLSEPEILLWIGRYLSGQYDELIKKTDKERNSNHDFY